MSACVIAHVQLVLCAALSGDALADSSLFIINTGLRACHAFIVSSRCLAVRLATICCQACPFVKTLEVTHDCKYAGWLLSVCIAAAWAVLSLFRRQLFSAVRQTTGSMSRRLPPAEPQVGNSRSFIGSAFMALVFSCVSLCSKHTAGLIVQ